jgi:hypothetical protein
VRHVPDLHKINRNTLKEDEEGRIKVMKEMARRLQVRSEILNMKTVYLGL